MSVRSAKDAIREARLKAGLTQEQLAEGVCSLQALSRIESGVSGVSPATFQALMEHAGASCERFPTFAGRDDFDCYCSLKYARFHLETLQLQDAYEELQKMEDRNWADNKLYYQEWLLLHCELQFYSYCCSHEKNYQTLLTALHITRPQLDLLDFRSLLLSQNEISLLTFLAQEALYLADTNTCFQICAQLENYLKNSKFAVPEKEIMQAELAIVQAKYLLAVKDYEKVTQTAYNARQNIIGREGAALLCSLTFLTGLGYYYQGNSEEADAHIKSAFYSAHAVESSFATACRSYLLEHTDYSVSEYMKELPDIPLKRYPVKKPQDVSHFSDGIYSADMAESYTLGDILHDLRTEQKLSLQIVCQGLCSNSKLSKIENGTLQPDIALAEALMQRLGLSERIFTFWGNEKEAKFYDLKFKILNIPVPSKENVEPYLEEMALLVDDNVAFRQEYLAERARLLPSAEEKIAALKESLSLTLPDFDIHQIHRYRLTWREIIILNNIAHAYRTTSESYLSSLYFSQLLEYGKKANLSMRLQANTLSFTLKFHCHSLYSQTHFNDILTLTENCDLSLLRHCPRAYMSFLFYYCQALGECGCFEQVILPAVYSYNLEYLTGRYDNAYVLKQCLQDDFSIYLNC